MSGDTGPFTDEERRALIGDHLRIPPAPEPASGEFVRVNSYAERDVLAERAKQRAKWGVDHDREHDEGSLAVVAAALAAYDTNAEIKDDTTFMSSPRTHIVWIDREGFDVWGLVEKHKHDRRRQLVIAAALLVAEIDRLDAARAHVPASPVTVPTREADALSIIRRRSAQLRKSAEKARAAGRVEVMSHRDSEADELDALAVEIEACTAPVASSASVTVPSVSLEECEAIYLAAVEERKQTWRNTTPKSQCRAGIAAVRARLLDAGKGERS